MSLTAVTQQFRVDQDLNGGGGGDQQLIVEALTDGGFAVAWVDLNAGEFKRISVRKFDASGNPVSQETRITGVDRENSDNGGQGFGAPSIAALPNGGFAVEYNDFGSGLNNSNGSQNFAFWTVTALFDANGALQSQTFPAGRPNGSSNSIFSSSITENGEGGYHLAYQQANSPGAVFVNGVQVASGDNISTTAIADFGEGAFVVYVKSDATGSGTNLAGRIVNGGVAGPEFLINTQTAGFQSMGGGVHRNENIATLTNGSVVVAWSDTSSADEDVDPGTGVRARIFGSDGQAVTGEILLSNTPGGDENQPTIAAMSGGRFVAVWREGDRATAQIFSSTGERIGGQVDLGIVVSASAGRLAVTVLTGDKVVVVWGNGVNAQVFQAPAAPIADNDAYQTDAGKGLTIGAANGVLVGDVDADSTTLTAFLKSGPANGDLTLNGDGSFTYTPRAGFSGTDTFTYAASDGSLESSPATVTITVKAPVQVQSGQTYDISANQNFTGSLSDFDDTKFEGLLKLLENASSPEENLVLANFILNAIKFDFFNKIKLRHGSIQLNIDGDGDGVFETVFTLADPAPNVTFLLGQQGEDSSITVQALAQPTGGDDTITGTDNPDYIAGGDGNDVLSGGGGSDALVGDAGADTLSGGAGADDLVGGDGVDTADYSLSPGAVLVNLSGSSALFNGVFVSPGTARDGFGSTDTLAGIENVTTGVGADRVRGSDDPNVLATGEGNDRIEGRGGDDLLDGGSGADTLIGGTGNDIYLVDDAGDTVTENVGEGTADEVRTALGSYSLVGADVELLTGTAAAGVSQQLTGNALANVITSGSGADRLDGGRGIDTLIGGGGNDVYVITARPGSFDQHFAENDTITELTDGGIDEVLFSVTNETGDPSTIFDMRSGYILPANVENLTLSATGFASITFFRALGNNLSNVITGSAGNDEISGEGGSDLLIGGAGDDGLDGGGRFFGDGAADTMRGGPGNDAYFVSDLGDIAEELADEGTDRIVLSSSRDNYTIPDNIENIGVVNPGGGIVQPASRTLTGNALDNEIIVVGGRVADLIDGGAGADKMEGGFEDDVYIVDNSGDVVIETREDGGTDEVRTALSTYTLPSLVEKLTYTGTAASSLRVNSGNNVVTGGDEADIFYLQDGGDDTASGGSGDDGFYFGGALTGADNVDGGEGALDQIGLQGGYAAGVTIGGSNIAGVEQLVFLPGNDTRFGDTSGALYDYKLTWSGGLASGQRLVLTANTLREGEDFTFDGSAETNGYFLTYGGLGTDILTGGQKDDGFFFGTGGRFGAQDKVDGQGGEMDQLGLQGVYTGQHAITFGADQLKGIEFIVALSGGDTRFGSNGGGYSYDLTMDDANVVDGATMIVSANTLRSDESLTFDGSAEEDGIFRIFSGRGADTITGGAGDDEISGGDGADIMNGGGGANTFVYTGVSNSTGTGFDQIVGFDYRVDKIDLPAAVGHFSDATSGKLNRATFDDDLAAALDGVLGVGEAAAFQSTSGDMAGRFFGIVDANGVAGYQAGEDYVVEFVNPVVIPTDPTIDFLI